MTKLEACVSLGVVVTLGAVALLCAETETSPRPAPPANPVAPAAPKPVAPESPVEPVAWPTPYPFFDNGAGDPQKWLQPTESGRWESGTFGMVRDSGTHFHEGVDIRPVARDKRGEPTDRVVAALAGRVAYANGSPNGPYGRYIVVERRLGGVTVYTLYAHLASLASGVVACVEVKAGDALGILGRSDASGGFPKARAHLHFEIGLRLSDNFDAWYRRRKFTTPNRHGDYNGINLAGLDPVAFFEFVRLKKNRLTRAELSAWFTRQEVAVLVEAPCVGTPAFVTRNPDLVVGGAPISIAGWRIGFTADGAPVRFEALAVSPGSVKMVSVEKKFLSEARHRELVSVRKNGAYAPGKTLATALELLTEF